MLRRMLAGDFPQPKKIFIFQLFSGQLCAQGTSLLLGGHFPAGTRPGGPPRSRPGPPSSRVRARLRVLFLSSPVVRARKTLAPASRSRSVAHRSGASLCIDGRRRSARQRICKPLCNRQRWRVIHLNCLFFRLCADVHDMRLLPQMLPITIPRTAKYRRVLVDRFVSAGDEQLTRSRRRLGQHVDRRDMLAGRRRVDNLNDEARHRRNAQRGAAFPRHSLQ
jgi:hypothetical protein